MSVAPILVLSCGGTISSMPGPRGATPALGAAQLVAEGTTGPAADLRAETFSTIPSADASLDGAVAIWRRANEWAADGGGGVVVTHGTDTLEEIAFAVEALGASPTPVVFTGAMRHHGSPGADGAANLRAAIVVAASPSAADCGVLVVLNDEIHLAARARKGHTSSVGAFTSPGLGPVGYVHEGRARIVVRPVRRPQVAPPVVAIGEVPVAQLTVGAGEDGRLLEAVGPAGFGGAVVEGTGGGHLPSRVATSESLRRLVAEMPVVIASRVGAGELLAHTYDFPGSERDLAERGLISAGTLDAPRARVLLSLLLAGRCPDREIRTAFAHFGGYRNGTAGWPPNRSKVTVVPRADGDLLPQDIG